MSSYRIFQTNTISKSQFDAIKMHLVIQRFSINLQKFSRYCLIASSLFQGSQDLLFFIRLIIQTKVIA